jgi:hypothetical protein
LHGIFLVSCFPSCSLFSEEAFCRPASMYRLQTAFSSGVPKNEGTVFSKHKRTSWLLEEDSA